MNDTPAKTAVESGKTPTPDTAGQSKENKPGSTRTRVITAIVAISLLAPCFYFFSDTVFLPIFSAACSVAASFELMRCIGIHKNLAVAIPTYLLAVAMPICTRISKIQPTYLGFSFTVGFIYLFYLFACAVFSPTKLKINDLAILFVMEIYIIFGMSTVVLVRDINYGEYLFWLIFLSAWMTDAGGYFIGRLFGRHKLCEHISPKKTVEGALGGVLFSAITFVVYGFFAGLIFNLKPNYPFIILLSVAIAVVSELGDLIASLIKRHYGAKDFGKLLPGHGGIMDRFDSIFAVAPFIFLISSNIGTIYAFFSASTVSFDFFK